MYTGYFNVICKLVSLLLRCQNEYTEKFLNNYTTTYNLKKYCVYKIIDKKSEEYIFDWNFLTYLNGYCDKLIEVQIELEEEIGNHFKISIDSRVKQPESRLSKLLVYRFEKMKKERHHYVNV
ncbi:hypothetical protein MUA90_00760 [Staphylococcus sp. IVB6181]|uniref:hypothetical protein n=1 Tax=Staphylococcus sp. IVB6181 TaxID=2929481 RepID=UPI0021CE04DC|nr:hypothetical protein [Staphylococcus sp. IVB6181]UXV35110.1 hypothetical protein MUA90_00760 [Staphylococcus sp. IVB6181]